MKTAIITPVNWLDRHGYQTNYLECLGSQAAFADWVILVQSVDAPLPDALFKRHRNIVLISGPATWSVDDLYDPEQLNRNFQRGIKVARELGADVSFVMACNWYIPETSYDGLNAKLERVDSWDYLYRGDQLNRTLFHASVRIPSIARVNFDLKPLWWPDGAFIHGQQVKCDRGDYADLDNEAVIDIQLETTLEDLAAKNNYVACYSAHVPKRKPVFDWGGYWHNYMRAKYQAKRVSGAPLSATGEAIAANNRPDFISNVILEDLGHEAA